MVRFRPEAAKLIMLATESCREQCKCFFNRVEIFYFAYMAKKKKKTKNTTTPTTLKTQWIAFFILGFSILLYANTLKHGFVFDDYFVISENFVVQKGVESIPTIWTTHNRYGIGYPIPETFRPIGLTMHAIEWQLSPNNPTIHHAVNILMYAITCVLLFYLLIQWMPKQRPLVLLATLFFVAHPVHTEVVANIKSRDEIMAFFFLLAALHILWRYHLRVKPMHLIGASVLYLLALFSKESAITYFAVFPLVLYFFTNRSLKGVGLISLTFILPVLVFFFARWQIAGALGNVRAYSILENLLMSTDSKVEQVATAIKIMGLYLGKLLIPHPLVSEQFYNQIPIVNFTDIGVWASLVAILGLLGFALIKLKDKHILSFAILFFAINMSIASNLIIMSSCSYGERFLYVPSLAFCLALAYGIVYFLGRKKSARLQYVKDLKHPVFIISAVLLGFYSLKTITRNQDWKSNLILFSKDVETSPNSAKMQFNYGVALMKSRYATTNTAAQQSYEQKAQKAFLKAIEIFPGYSNAYGELGLLLFEAGKSEEALQYYKQAIALEPNDPETHSNMGLIYNQMGDQEAAKQSFRKAIEYNTAFVNAMRNLAGIYLVERNFPEAIKWYEQALEYQPDNAEMLYFLGQAYGLSGDASKGQELVNRAIQLDPSLRN